VIANNRVTVSREAQLQEKSRGFFYRFIYVAVALLSLLVTSLVFHSLLPPSIPEGVVEKLRFFAAHKGEFDTLFLGTSRIYYAVSPEIFDSITRENGMPTRTFNFGIDSLHPPENFYVLDQILKTNPQKLKWIFVDLDNIQTKSNSESFGTQRLLYWHDWPRTALTLKKAIDPRGGAKWDGKLIRLWSARRQILLHVGLFEKQFTNVGRALDFLPAHDQGSGPEPTSRLGPKGDGYRTAGPPMTPARAANFRRMLAEEVATARPRFIDPYADSAYREYAEKIRAVGAAPIFVVTPGPSQSLMRFRKSPPPGPLLSFNDCKAYPQLYDAQARADEGHLTNEGAVEFTRLLALELVHYARQR